MGGSLQKLMGGGRKSRIQEMQAQIKQDAADKALREAMRPAADSQQAIETGDKRLRKLLNMRGARANKFFGGGDAAPANITFRQLTGS